MSGAAILFGNSPFLHQVDIERLLPRYATVGFNGFGQHYPVDALFVFDRWFDTGLAKSCFHPVHIPAGATCRGRTTAFTHRASPKPFLPNDQKRFAQQKHLRTASFPILAFKYFTPSIALNWLLLQGCFQRVYLVGIDNVETDTRFQHHDGAVCNSQLTPKAHQAFKQYVYECAKHIEIYQCNPAVADSWKLPFKDVEALYGPPQSQ